MAGERGARTAASPPGGRQRWCRRRRGSSPGGQRGPARRGARSLTLRLHLLPPPRSGAPRAAASWAGLSGYKGGRRARGVGFLSLPLQLHRAVRRRQRDEAPPKAAEAGGAPAAARPRDARPGPGGPREGPAGCRGTWCRSRPGGGGRRPGPSARLRAGSPLQAAGRGRPPHTTFPPPARRAAEGKVTSAACPAPGPPAPLTEGAGGGRSGRPVPPVKNSQASPRQSPESRSQEQQKGGGGLQKAGGSHASCCPRSQNLGAAAGGGCGTCGQAQLGPPVPGTRVAPHASVLSSTSASESDSDMSPVLWSPQTTNLFPPPRNPP